jgi:hypothetical protein
MEVNMFDKTQLIFTKLKEKHEKSFNKMSTIDKEAFERRLFMMALREVIPYTWETIQKKNEPEPKPENNPLTIEIREIPE